MIAALVALVGIGAVIFAVTRKERVVENPEKVRELEEQR